MSITSQQGPYARFPCSRCFQEEINDIQILQELLPYSYNFLIQLLLYLVDKLVVVRAKLNITGISELCYIGTFITEILTTLIGISWAYIGLEYLY